MVKTVAARFYAWGFFPLFNLNLQALPNAVHQLDAAWLHITDQLEQAVLRDDDEAALDLLHDFLIERALNVRFEQKEIQAASQYLLDQKGQFKLSELADYCNYSSRTRRNLLNYSRNLEDVISATIQPILFVLIFRYVFGGAVKMGDTDYANYLMPGIFVQAIALTSMATAISLAQDLHTGLIDRFRSLPMSSSSVLAARTIATLVRNGFVLIVMLIVGLLVGFRPQGDALRWLAAAGLLLLFGFAVSWVAIAFGLMIRSLEAVQNISLTLVMPLTFLSSAFVLTQTMPPMLRVFADNQPMTPVINAVRNLLLDQPIGSSGWLALAWSIALIVVFAPLAVTLYRRTTAR